MLSSSTHRIAEAIAQLRQLTQQDIQTQWHYQVADLPVAVTTESEGEDWPVADLNAKGHIAWSAGRQVLWLKQNLVVPADLQGYPLRGLSLRLALTWWAEDAQIFVNGKLVQAGDLFDCSTRILLSAAVQPGEAIAVTLRLVSPGHDQGALVKSQLIFESTSPEFVEPGFVADELAVLHQYLQTFEPEKLERLTEAIATLDWSTLPVPADQPPQKFNQALAVLRQQLQPLAQPLKQRQIHLLGHAHLDLAWLWPVSETWEAAERTFQSVLKLQEDFPELIFCHSSPALYAWIEANRPELFTAIQQQIATGRWEVVAGLWVEPELNLINGESIVRQVLYGQHYVQQKFGRLSQVAWLPDTFGFCWQLPQILKQGGVDYFVTQKLRWNDTTQFPHELFWWRSPDGSEILSFMSPPIGEGIDPVKMATYACDWESKTGTTEAFWLPGVGDHGGGPTRDMLEVAQRWQKSPLFPQLQFTPALNYLQHLESQAKPPFLHTPHPSPNSSHPSPLTPLSSSPLPPSPYPTWNDELYLEFHRGCYTTHADQKRWNRYCEGLLYQAELFAALATLSTGASYPKTELERAWKQVLFNQFHDILPGSAIPQVFVDAEQDWQAAEQTGAKVLDQALQAIATHIQLPPPPHPDAQPFVVFNSLNWPRSEVLTIAAPPLADPDLGWQIYDSIGHPLLTQIGSNTLIFKTTEIPAVGYSIFWICQVPISQLLTPANMEPCSPGEFVLTNEYLCVEVNPQTGDLSSVCDRPHQREILAGAGNQLQAFRDQGQYWDAWNIDPNYAQYPLPAATLQSIDWLERGPLQTRLRVVRRVGQSEFCQDYVLQSNSGVLKIETTVDWQERHTLLKAAFPLLVNSDQATYEIPCGAIQRPTRPTDARDQAKWEVPALRWADLGQPDYGVSLLNDCKYGYDSQPNQLRLTLLRGAEWPDPDADRGMHQFTYALYPHVGNWQSAQTVRRGYELNLPLQVFMLSSDCDRPSSPTLPPTGQFLSLQAENLVLSAFKQAEADPQKWILRCYEAHGAIASLKFKSDLPLAIAQPLDLLERLLPDQPASDQPTSPLTPHPSPLTLLSPQLHKINPWEIASFEVKMATHRSPEVAE